MKAIYTGGNPKSFKTGLGPIVDQLNKTGLLNKEIDVEWDDKNECFKHDHCYFHMDWLTFPEKIKGIYRPGLGPDKVVFPGGRQGSKRAITLGQRFTSVQEFTWDDENKCYRYNGYKGCYFLHPAWIEVVEDGSKEPAPVSVPEIKFKSCAEIINKIEELKNGKII